MNFSHDFIGVSMLLQDLFLEEIWLDLQNATLVSFIFHTYFHLNPMDNIG